MIITQNPRMLKLVERIEKLCDSDCSVLITGETGTGKEIIANYIQKTSKRKDENYIKLNLAAMPKDLLESELFGHEKGSFTSAHLQKKGLFEEADKGTIFLDDIDDMPLYIQPKLLRVLENKEFRRVGGVKKLTTDVRIISSTKINLKDLIELGAFRDDLFYRLNVMTINIPPLRERSEDIKLLTKHFLKEDKKNKIEFNESEYKILESHHWQGNVRELKNFVEKISILKENDIHVADYFEELATDMKKERKDSKCLNCSILNNRTLPEAITIIETKFIEKALMRTGGNISKSAEILGLKRTTLIDKMAKHKIKFE